MNAGEETVRGVSVPPLPIVNVAGTRTLEAPPAGGLELAPAGGLGLAPPVGALGDEELAGAFPALVDEAGRAELVRVPVAAVRLLVAAGRALSVRLLVSEAEVLAVEWAVEELAAAALLELCEELPHAPTSTAAARHTDAIRRRVTGLSIGRRRYAQDSQATS